MAGAHDSGGGPGQLGGQRAPPAQRPRPSERSNRRPAKLAPPQSTLVAVGSALLWVILAMGSVASTVVALWVILSLGKAALAHNAAVLAGGLWLWVVAIVVSIALPVALALWKNHGAPRQLSQTLVWLPLAWNGGGLALATQVIPDVIGAALRGNGAWVAADRLGDSHAATRVMSALGHHAADRLDPAGREPTFESLEAWTELSEEQVDRSKAISVPFTEEGTAILMDVTFAGKSGPLTLPYLFDTGASFTTISSETAAKLGIEVPADAPVLTFNTASGPRESRMVYLPSLTLGAIKIEGLLVSVCDGCVNERHQGLLGQNVMREFYVQIDFRSERMIVLPRVADARPNRAYDIAQVVELTVEGSTEVMLGRVRWVVRVENRGTVPIRGVIPVVKFTDGPALRGKPIDEIAPGAVGRSLVEGRAPPDGKGESKRRYTLGVVEAYW